MNRNLFLFILCCLFFSMQVDSSPCREAVNGKRKVFLPFEQAMEKVRRAGVSSRREYSRWRKDHPDMPSRPYDVYAGYWQGWRHFLGTIFLTWEQAVLKVRRAGVLSQKEYEAWTRDRPDMPFAPQQFYMEHWGGWRHFLGTFDIVKAIKEGKDLKFLTGLIFSGLDLRGFDFSGKDLTGAIFLGTDLRGAIFFQAHLWNADFRGAKMSDELREYARAQGAILDI